MNNVVGIGVIFVTVMAFAFGSNISQNLPENENTTDNKINDTFQLDDVYRNRTIYFSNASRAKDSVVISDILDFMNTYTRACNEACTVFTSTDVNPKEDCCSRCHCTDNCTLYGTCCSDYWLKTFLQIDAPFPSLRHLQSYLYSMNESTLTLLDSIVSGEVSSPIQDLANYTSDSDTLPYRIEDDCQRTQVHERVSMFKPEPSSVLLVSTCPDGSSASIVQKCAGLSNTGDILDFVPVMVVATGISYKNRHCLKCNGKASLSVEYWDAAIVCENTALSVYVTIFMLSDVASIDFTYCAVQFIPNKERGIVAKRCTKNDIHTCADAETSSVLKHTCRVSNSRYGVQFSQEKVWAKDIACYMCSSKTIGTSMPSCYDVFINVKMDLNLNAYLNRMDSGGNGVINRRFHPLCKRGFAYDTYLKICRKVNCPRFHMLVDGVCVPTITNIFRIVVGTTFIVTFSQPFLWHSNQSEAFSMAHAAILSNVNSILSPNSNVSFWLYDEQPDNQSLSNLCLIYVTFTPTNFTLSEILQGTQELLNTLSAFNAILNVQYTSTFKLQAASKGTVVDMEHGLLLRRVYPLDQVHLKVDVYISDASFCPTVMLNDDEIVYMRKDLFVLSYADVKIYHADGGPVVLDSLNRRFICYQYVQTNMDIVKTEIIRSHEDNQTSKIVTLTLSIGVVGGVLICIWALNYLRMKTCRKCQSAESSSGSNMSQ